MHNLIFDFDGVLADTYEAAVECRIGVSKYSTREESIAEMNEYFGSKPNHTKDHTLTDEELKTMYDWVTNYGHLIHEHGFSLFENFIEAIKQIPNKRIALVSSGSQNYVLPALANSGLEFTHILAFENHHSKEEKIETICKDWGIAVSDAYYFTDTLADVFELQNHIDKDKLIGVSWGYCTKEQLLTELDDNHILNKPEEILSLLSE